MDNEMNQQSGQVPPQTVGQADFSIPPYQQMNPGIYPYPPCYHHHHKFWEKKISISLWKCLLAGALVVIFAFGLGAHSSRSAGIRRGRKIAPFMVQVPNGGQYGFYYDNGGGSLRKGEFQIPNDNTQSSNDSFQIPKGNFQIPNMDDGYSSGQNGRGNNWRK